MRRLLVPVLLAAAALAHAEEASAGCISAVVVDERLLVGGVVQHPDQLPPRQGKRDAIFPACNDGGGPIAEDQEGTVRRLRGMPARIAVTGAEPDSVYVDEGSLTIIATHPLHGAFHGRPGAPSYRSGRECRPYRTAVRGEVLRDGVLRIRTADRVFSVDAATRFTNRPVYEPVLEGQRLRVATSRCGPRRVADRVTFVGATPRPELYRRSHAAGGGLQVDGWQVVLALVLGSAAALIALIWKYVGR